MKNSLKHTFCALFVGAHKEKARIKCFIKAEKNSMKS